MLLIAAMRLLLLLLASSSSMVVVAIIMLRRHDSRAALQIDVDAAGILFGRVLQTEFLTYLLDSRFDLLDVVYGVVPFPYDPVFGISARNDLNGSLR